jgi:hypothetical protein
VQQELKSSSFDSLHIKVVVGLKVFDLDLTGLEVRQFLVGPGLDK